MQSISDNLVQWPIKGHLRRAVDMLEARYVLGGLIDAPREACRSDGQPAGSVVCSVLRSWSMKQELPTAVLGFPENPGVIALRWLLEEAGLGEVCWERFPWTEETFSQIHTAVKCLAKTRVVVDSGPSPTVEAFYARALRFVREFGVARILAWERVVPGGLPLSTAPRPWGWLEEAGFEESHFFILQQ